jgi:hypothetical protein
MNDHGTQTVKPLRIGLATEPSAHDRRMDLLRHVAKLGGTLTPHPNPDAKNGYEFSSLSADAERELIYLVRHGYLEERFFDRVSLCPKCASHHLNLREICPGCLSPQLCDETLLHHFRCGYVGRVSEFSATGIAGEQSLACPKCQKPLSHLGTQYDQIGKAHYCLGCGLCFQDSPVEAVCLSCEARVRAENLVSIDIFSYTLSSHGSEALQRGRLSEDSDIPLTLEGLRIYRPPVILELLEQEGRRIKHFNQSFCALLVRITHVGAMDLRKRTALFQNLRRCLRDVDSIGQLTASLYLVILPQTHKQGAEDVSQIMRAKTRDYGPLAISVFEIAKVEDLRPVLMHRPRLIRAI